VVVACDEAECEEVKPDFTSVRRLHNRIADAWRPRERIPTPEWVTRNVRLPAEFGTPGKYDLDDFPYWRGVLALLDDPEVFEIVIEAATQIGKTEALKAMMCAQSDVDPCPMMLVGPDRDFMAELRDKVYASAELSPALKDRIPAKGERNMRWIDFGRCYAYLAWVRNTQRISGKAAKVIFCTEIDRYHEPSREGTVHKLISERVKSFARYKILKESTPTDENSAIDAHYQESDRRKFLCPCPQCGHHQELRFFTHKSGPYKGRGGVVGMQDEKGEWLKPEQALEAAYYLCEKGCRIDSHQKPGMVARGVWCPEGQSVDKRGRLVGTPNRPPRVAGVHLGSIYARVITFGRIAAEYLRSRESEEAMRNFWNNWLGLKFTIQTKIPKWRTLGTRLACGYPRGKGPAAALFLTAGVDVQDDRIYWLVRAWGEGATSWLIEFGSCHQKIDPHGHVVRNSDLEQLRELVIDRRFPLVAANPVGAISIPVRLANVDCNYQSHRVWDFVRQFPGDRVRAVAGDHRMAAEFYQMTVVEKSARDGKPYIDGLKRWGVNRDTYNRDVQQRWSTRLDQPGAWCLPHRIVDDGETYLRQVTNETEMTVVNKKGRPERIWKVIDERLGNHFWDCEVYARVAADMVTGGDWRNLVARIRPVEDRPDSARNNDDRPLAARNFSDDFSAR